MRVSKFLSGLFFLFWVISALAEPSQQDDVVDLQLRWHDQFQFAGYYAAVEKGFYQEEGLKVRLHAGDPAHKPVHEVLSGRAQYAQSNSEVLYQRLQGKPLVALAAIFQHSPSALLVRADSGIDSAQGLVGKKVMLLNGKDEADFLAMFSNEGISLSQVNIISESYNLEDLVTGKTDAFHAYLTDQPYFLKQRNIPYKIIDPKNYGVDFYSDILFTTESELRDHPKRVEALRRATLRGWRYAMDHPEEIIDLLINKYHVEKTRKHLEFEATEMRKLILPDLVEIGHMNPGRWQHMAGTFVKAGLIKPNYSLDGFMYDTTPKRLPEWVVPVLIAAFIVIVAISLFMYYLLQLNRRLTSTKATLRESEAHFRRFFENNSSVMLLVDPDSGRVVDANQSAVAYYGYPLNQLIGVSIDQINTMTPEEIGLERQRALHESRNYLNFRHRLASGDVREVEVHCTPIADSGKTLLFSIIHDITGRKQAENELLHSQQVLALEKVLLQTILDNAPIGIWMVDVAGRVQFINKTFCDATGISEQQFVQAKHYSDVLPSSNTANCIHSDQECMAQVEGTHVSTEWLPFVDGKDHLLDITKVKVLNQDGSIKGMIGLASDITERKQAESRLQLAASVFSHAREGILITDASGIIIEVNDTFIHITGYGREEVLGENPRILQSNRHVPEFYATMWRELTSIGHWTGEVWNRRRNGEVYAEILTISAVHDADGVTQNYVALFTDITPMKEHQQQLEYIAHYDALTSLPNRVLLADRLQQAMIQSQRRDESLAVVYLDLDGFKAVNDAHGHDVGDDLLITLAQRMKASLREGDTLARIGGDEFVAVLVDLEQALDCEPVLVRLLQAAADPVMVGAAVLQVSASVGVTIYPQDGVDADQLMRHADQAMYVAKQAGKNRYHLFDIAQDVAVKTQRESLEHIRRALDQCEFVLYYQPKVNMKTGEVIGAEALIRWQHPERGLLPPAAFLPTIEGQPISIEVGEWVSDEALRQLVKWQQAGLEIPVSINVAGYQLQQPDFVDRLDIILARYPEISSSLLELEILESSALEIMVTAETVIAACSRLGVTFSLDDFGTGYSSLTHLRRLPASVLKIDQSFVRDMLDDSDDLAIVGGVVGLASTFRRQVIAEGVESIAHGELLLPLGCELAQGYGIARPMPAADMLNWVATWRPAASWTAWHERTPNRNDLAVVFAEVEYRQWLRAIDAFLAGKLAALPSMKENTCHFGRWHESDGRARYGDHPEFLLVVDLHDRLHTLGRNLIEQHVRGEQVEAQVLFGELRIMCGDMIARLRELVRCGENVTDRRWVPLGSADMNEMSCNN